LGLERSGGSKPLLFTFTVGEARRRGGGTIQAAAIPPPKYDDREGGVALGGRSALGSRGAYSAGKCLFLCAVVLFLKKDIRKDIKYLSLSIFFNPL
jgi:hypothetical protein